MFKKFLFSISFLFFMSAIADAQTISLPRTGQTKCYDHTTFGVIACAGTGQDGEFRAGTPIPDPRFTDNGDGTMTDNLTGLIWLQDLDCFPNRTWGQALTDVSALANGQCGLADGSIAGDWRVPNVVELESLFHGGKMMDHRDYWLSVGFTGTASNNAVHWSSTTNQSLNVTFKAYTLGGGYGGTFGMNQEDKSGGTYALAVRGATTRLWKTGQTTCYDTASPYAAIPCAGTGQDGEYQMGVAWPVPRFTDNGDGTVTDNLTGLVWLKNANCFGNLTSDNAITAVSTLAAGQCGLTDGSTAGQWRVPNRKELYSLLDQGVYNPKVPAGHPFTNVPVGYQLGPWTSTSYPSPKWSWGIFFGDTCCGGSGSTTAFAKGTKSMPVWPVREGAVSSFYPDVTISDSAAPADDLQIAFGNVTEGTSSTPETITITNDGGADLNVTNIQLTGADPGDFVLNLAGGAAPCNNTAVTLAKGQNCTVTMAFSPALPGAKAAALQIDSNDSVNPSLSVSLSGTGTAAPFPDITVTDPVAPTGDLQVPFGNFTENTSVTQSVTITNDGNADLNIGQIGLADPLAAPFTILNDTCSGGILQPAIDTCTFDVQFSPTAPGVFNDTLDIPSDDPDENPVTVTVSGTGTAAPAPDIAVTDTIGNMNDLQMAFPDTTEGTSSNAETVTISNAGNAPLNISNIQLTGTDPGEFTLDLNGGVSPCGAANPVVAAAGNCDVIVTFSPTSVGVKLANVEITSDDPDENPVYVQLSGTGLTSVVNNPPNKPNLVFPANGQQGLPTTVTFEWEPVTDPDGDPVSYDIYICPNDTNPFNCAPNQVATLGSQDTGGQSPGKTYYAGMAYGAGLLFFGVILAGGVKGRKRVVLLIAMSMVTGSLLVSCAANTGTNNNNMTYTATGLTPGTPYSWAVEAKDNKGGATLSDPWNFTTR